MFFLSKDILLCVMPFFLPAYSLIFSHSRNSTGLGTIFLYVPGSIFRTFLQNSISCRLAVLLQLHMEMCRMISMMAISTAAVSSIELCSITVIFCTPAASARLYVRKPASNSRSLFGFGRHRRICGKFRKEKCTGFMSPMVGEKLI